MVENFDSKLKVCTRGPYDQCQRHWNKRTKKMPPYNPPNAFYTEVAIPIYVNMLSLMGKGGANLKYITEKSGCQYLWVDTRRSVVEIWGREKRLPAAIAMVRSRIARMTDVSLTEPPEYQRLQPELKVCISVKSWKSPSRNVYYEIEGVENGCVAFFHILLSEYPENPYMTKIIQRSRGRMVVCRLGSSD